MSGFTIPGAADSRSDILDFEKNWIELLDYR